MRLRGPSIRRCDLHGWSGELADHLFATLTGMLAAGEPAVGLRAFDCEFTPKVGDVHLALCVQVSQPMLPHTISLGRNPKLSTRNSGGPGGADAPLSGNHQLLIVC